MATLSEYDHEPTLNFFHMLTISPPNNILTISFLMAKEADTDSNAYAEKGASRKQSKRCEVSQPPV
jgi:hypothetical protein